MTISGKTEHFKSMIFVDVFIPTVRYVPYDTSKLCLFYFI